MTLTRRISFAALALLFLVAPASVEARQIALAWDANPEPEVDGYTLYYGTQAGIYTNTVEVGNLISYMIDLPGVQYYFAIRAHTPTGLTSPMSTEVAESSAIALTDPGTQIDAPGLSVSLQLVAAGTAASYTATNLPGGLSINAATGQISGIISSGAAASSPYLVYASVSNAAGNKSSVQFTWTIAANNAPSLTQPANQTSAENAPVSLQLAASDPDGDVLTYSATGLPPSLTVNATSGLISGTPPFTSAGSYSVTATVSDGSLSNSKTFTWTITNVNRAPTLTQPANQTSAEGAVISLQLVASDPDGTAVTYSATGLPSPLTVNATGLISGTLPFTAAGSYSVTATASDGTLSNSKTFTWTVTNVNRAPTLTAPANQTSAENAAVSLQLVASDPDGTALTYSATGLPSPLTVNATTGLISGTLSFTSAGSYSVTATASDGSMSDSKTFTWTVTNVNRAPTLTAPANQTGVANAAASLQLVASDPDGTALTYSATGLPPSLAVNATTGLISGTLSSTSAGTYSVTATASDGSLSNSKTFTWTVTPPSGPVTALTVTANLAAPQPPGTTITLTAAATGGTAPYQFKWWVFNGSGWTVLQDWNAAASYAWTPATANPQGTVEVWVRSAGNLANVSEKWADLPFAIPSPFAVTANLPAPQGPGTTITLTASGASGTAPYQFKWWVYSAAGWTVLQDWSAAATYTWTPTTLNPQGIIEVWMRSAGNSANSPEQWNDLSFAILPPVTVTANLAAPQAPGTSITLTAAALGGTAPYQFKWWVSNAAGWTVLQDWNAAASYTWTPTTANPLGMVEVWMRSAGNSADAPEKYADLPYSILSSPITALTVTANLSAPQIAGTSITLTPIAAGGTAPYQFKWYVFSSGGWTLLQDWSAAPTYTWTPTTANPQGLVEVWVRSAGNPANSPEKWADLPFVIQ